MTFRTGQGVAVPAVTAEQMREVDRVAVEDFKLGILQMMENAGRNLAQNAMAMLGTSTGEVTILAGAGGNGGGGLCCARHLHNRGYRVQVILDREAETFTGAARTQLDTLQAAGIHPINDALVEVALRRSQVVVDALIGYGLRGKPRDRTARLIELCNQDAKLVLSNDVPSGIDATTGETPGAMVRADRILTLAAPKTGLKGRSEDIYLADIGIPPQVFHRLGLDFVSPFETRYWVRLTENHP